MTIKTWVGNTGILMAYPEWTDGLTPAPNDELLVHTGTAVAVFDNLAAFDISVDLGSLSRTAPATLSMGDSWINVDLSWIPGPGDNPNGAGYARYSSIDAWGWYDVVKLSDSGISGSTLTKINIGYGTNLFLTQTLTDYANVVVQGAGHLVNVGTQSLFNTSETVFSDVIGLGIWNLSGNDRLEFLAGVDRYQTINVNGNSTLMIDNTGRFNAAISGQNFSGEIFLNGIEADQAMFAKDVLTITGGGGQSNIRLNLSPEPGQGAPTSFDVYKGPTGGAVIVQDGRAPPQGYTQLLLQHLA